MMTPTESERDPVHSAPSADDGGTAVEYAIIATLIAAVIAGAVGLLGQKVVGLFPPALSEALSKFG